MDTAENSLITGTEPDTQLSPPNPDTEAVEATGETFEAEHHPDELLGIEEAGLAEEEPSSAEERLAPLEEHLTEGEPPSAEEHLTEEEPAPTEERQPVDPVPVARDLLDQILQEMGVPASVVGERQPEGSVRLLVEGSDMGVVIGKHGGTINALQYLLSLILQKRVGERIRLVIDAEGYRSRREQALRDLAHTYARRVKESGQEAVLDALQAYERRIIHNSLADDPAVFTYSEGEEPERRVVISPREAEEA